ncbi:hypothetical protein [Pantoea stewartii]|uniref:hypothetical protein n=1 Tax=Pantoea stewartii TaxID=66269 RepID=UPI0025A23143|nr:hypothetical protein [Pantoea stewartii]
MNSLLTLAKDLIIRKWQRYRQMLKAHSATRKSVEREPGESERINAAILDHDQAVLNMSQRTKGMLRMVSQTWLYRRCPRC